MINNTSVLDELNSALSIDINGKEGFVKPGYSHQLDALYDLAANASHSIDVLRDKYREISGVNNLKISHNNVIGYFVEVTPANASKVTDDIFQHRQTLGSAVRYTTAELKTWKIIC